MHALLWNKHADEHELHLSFLERQQGAERAITLTRWACPCSMGG